ncbi:hypothetical protein [Fulvimarina endophytica]|nr:hypothetical protein [Fulvimarina endophytica]
MSADDYAWRRGEVRFSGTPARADGVSDRVVRFLSWGVVVFSVGFFSVVTTISYLDPGFFDRLLIAGIEERRIDPIMVGSTSSHDKEGEASVHVEPMPAPVVVRSRELTPQDFSIVMVFGDEAHLASPGELWRVKAGMIVPGLGKVLAVEENEGGGTIKTEKAVLTGVPQ